MKIQPFLGILAACFAVATGRSQTVDTVVTNLFEPHAVTVDDEGNYYIADSANNRIIKYFPEADRTVVLAGETRVAGTNDGPGIFARFFDPEGIVSARGGLVVADSGNHTIRFLTLQGATTTLAGLPEVPGFADGRGAAARFRFPVGLAADTNGNIYIADSKNNAVRKLDTANVVTTLALGFNEPSAVAVGDHGEIFVADTRNHSIRVIETNGAVTLLAGSGSRFLSGFRDSLFATNALFNNPRGVAWFGPEVGLLVSDTGNQVIRRVFFNQVVGGYSVETFAGVPGEAGLVNGPLTTAKFNSPIGLVRDPRNGGFLVIDSANQSLRRIQLSPPRPPVARPLIGWVDFVLDAIGVRRSVLRPVTQSVFNNDVIVAILAEEGTETFFTVGPTPASNLEDKIPPPGRLTGNSPPDYEDGLLPSEVPPSIISAQPDLLIKAIGVQDGRLPSTVTQARFQFKVGNPVVFGDNPAFFKLTEETRDALMWYTLDGTEPTNDGSNPSSIGPKFDGDFLSLNVTESNVLFSVKGFRPGYSPSGTSTKLFTPTNFIPNRISFGFEAGEASSDFVGASGQTFYAPVTLTLLPNQEQKMYTFQFNVAVTNLTGPPVGLGEVGFASMLLKANPAPPNFLTIFPEMFVRLEERIEDCFTNVFTNFFTGTIITNIDCITNQVPIFSNMVHRTEENLLAVGWIERFNIPHPIRIYDPSIQDLIKYSMAHDTLFESGRGKIVLGGYAFRIPPGAVNGQTYQIQLGRPSATSDGINNDIFIDTPTNGSRTVGPINSIKTVTVGSRPYIVGDVAPFRWFNAGDFGDGSLLNNDVIQVFQSAVHRVNTPPPGSDFFDALDSSDGTVSPTNAPVGDFEHATDAEINAMRFGDGVLAVDDVFTTYHRALDPTLTWYARYWSNGVRQVVAVPNVFRPPATNAAPPPVPPRAAPPVSGPRPTANFSAGVVAGAPGQTVSVPVRAVISGNYPLRVLMLGLHVKPLDGGAELTEPVQFIANPALGEPTLKTAEGAGNFAGAWLRNTGEGLTGDSYIGTLKMTIPADASPTAAYSVHFDHVSASPNGLRLFANDSEDGLVILGNASRSRDGIPDAWRLRYFGSVSSGAAHAFADPDRDGQPNWAEFKAGTNPNSPRSSLSLASRLSHGLSGNAENLVLRWPTVSGKQYVVERSDSAAGGQWGTVSPVITGTGADAEYSDSDASGRAWFYRLRLLE